MGVIVASTLTPSPMRIVRPTWLSLAARPRCRRACKGFVADPTRRAGSGPTGTCGVKGVSGCSIRSKRVKDGTDGAENVELNDRTPKDALVPECIGGVQTLELAERG